MELDLWVIGWRIFAVTVAILLLCLLGLIVAIGFILLIGLILAIHQTILSAAIVAPVFAAFF